MAKIGDLVVYQTQNGDLLPEGYKAAEGEIYRSTAAIVIGVEPNEVCELYVMLGAARTPIAFGQYGKSFSIGGVTHGNAPNEWRTQDEAGRMASHDQFPKARGAGSGTDSESPRERTVAELKDLAELNGIDLGDSTRRADIRTKVIEGLPSVASLRDLARQEGVDLHGAQSRADIAAALGTPAVPVVEPPSVVSTFSGFSGSNE